MLARLPGIALLAVLAAGYGPSALAAPRRADSPEKRLASAEFKRGKQLYAAGDYAGALESFQNGFDAYPLRGFLVNIGQCHRRLGHLKEAAVAYQQFLDGTDVSSALRAEVEEALEEVRAAQREAAPAETPAPAAATAEPAPAPSPGAQLTTETVSKKPPEKKKSRAWVWALVGIGAAAVVGGVTAGVVLGVRGSGPSGGSLGLIDGRGP